ncbi:1-propanol dehydrogenase PduQ [Vibrio sp. 10N.222.51.C12]|uniref:1-propanol dehydrogenase PduQ n=1 Tax=unclassified Vibrio TaxID=2614977 RepID=UPI000C8203E9|nr:1-propanol dehydrogenase PduQ [Vibrio sp. 10N.286.48.B7]PMH81204.1 propanediol utilization protein [Vibrio sp. 10N.286.48.B7]
MKKFSVRTRVYSGIGSLNYLSRFKNRKVWIVCDEFLATSPVFDKLKALLSHNEVSVFSDITSDPDIAAISKGIESLKEVKPNIIIGFGGGSAIDAAKAIRFIIERNESLNLDCCIAIPTTSGTGSEVTSATVISDKELGIKYPIFHPDIFPDIAILDPELVLTVPPHITANTGMDVLTHAIEAYVSTESNEFSDALAEKAVSNVFRYLEGAFQNGDCIVRRTKMHNASSMAGMAFSQAGLGLNHAIAHQLGGQFKLPHGLSNAILLPHVVRQNAKDPKTRKRYAKLAKHCLLASKSTNDITATNQLILQINQLARKLKINMSLRRHGISEAALKQKLPEIIFATHNDSTITTNPVSVTDNDIKRILEAAL